MNHKLFAISALSLLCAFNSQFSTARAQAIWTSGFWTAQWGAIACSADGTKVYAASPGEMVASTDSGVTWASRNTSQGWHVVTCSADGTKLAASCGDATSVFTSTDSGTTFTVRSDTPGYEVSIASSADGTKLVEASYYDIYTSINSGTNWVDQPESGRLNWSSVACSTNGTKLVAVVHGGWIYTSTDSGVTWMPRDSSRTWNAVASSADGTKLVAVDGAPGHIYTSTDSGTNWTPRGVTTNWQAVASSADGTKLVAAVHYGQIYTSTDSGTNWTAGDTNRAWQGVACSADGTKLFAVENAGASGGQIYISGVVIPPKLNIINLGSSVGVSWPYPSTGWTLQQNTNLTSASWSPSSGVTNNGHVNYIIVAPSARNLFFRLHS